MENKNNMIMSDSLISELTVLLNDALNKNYTRREVLKLFKDGAALVSLYVVAMKLGISPFCLKAAAAGDLYGEFVRDFSTGTVVPRTGNSKGINFEWIYFKNASEKNATANVKNNYYQAVITDASHNPFIYNNYVSFINKIRSTSGASISDFDKNVAPLGKYNYYSGDIKVDNQGNFDSSIVNSQRGLLYKCEYLLYVITKNNDKILRGDEAALNAGYDLFRTLFENVVCPDAPFGLNSDIVRNTPFYETLSEMIQAAWDKVPAIDYFIQHSKPYDAKLGPKNAAYGACVQDVVATICGNRTRGERTKNTPKHSGTQKGTAGEQMSMFVTLNNYSYNRGIACSVVAWAAEFSLHNPRAPFTEDSLKNSLFIDDNELKVIKNEIAKNNYHPILTGYENLTNSIELGDGQSRILSR